MPEPINKKWALGQLEQPIFLDDINEARTDPPMPVSEVFQLYGDGKHLKENRFVYLGIEYEYDKPSGQLRQIAFHHKSKRYSASEFWQMEYDQKTRRQYAELDEGRYHDFLKEAGFRRILDPSGGFYDLIQIRGKSIEKIGDQRACFALSDFVRTHVQEVGDSAAFRMLVRKDATMFGNAALRHLPYLDKDILRDDATSSYLCFRNGVLTISEKSAEIRNNESVSGLVWKHQILDYDFKQLPIEEVEQSQFFRFINLCVNGRDAKALMDLPRDVKHFVLDDSDIRGTLAGKRLAGMLTALGYSLYRWKDPRVTKLVLGVDRSLQRDGLEANGGTGKGLVGQSIGKVRNQFYAPGRTIDIKSPAAFARLSRLHEHVWIPDLDKNFPMHLFLNNLTEGWTVRELYKNEVVLQFADSPKVWMDTNYTLRGSGNTFDRRIYVVEFAEYFCKAHTPWHEFGMMLYDDWDDQEWMRFYNVCVLAIQRYMRWGLVEAPVESYKSRKLSDDIPESAIDFFEDLEPGKAYPLKSYTDKNGMPVVGLLEEFVQQNQETKNYRGGMNQKKLRSWMAQWAQVSGHEVNAHVSNADKRDRRRPTMDSTRVDMITITGSAGSDSDAGIPAENIATPTTPF